MQSGLADAKGDLRRGYVRVESGLTKRCQLLKESSDGEKAIVLIEDEPLSVEVFSRHLWLEKSSALCESGCEVCFIFGNLLQCRYCGRHFHELCSCMPEAKVLGATSSPTFTCRDCFFMLYASLKGMEKGGCAKNSIIFIKEVKKYRTYAYRELRWDSLHRFNRSSVYCYCGGPGHFSKGMLQCLRCLQWFHRACLHCLSPERDILPWDCFWFFKCAYCNGEYGEVCKQLPVVWPELLHLALMNLCLRRNDFCHVKEDIMAWLTENWKHIAPDKSVSLAFETAETIEEKLKSDPARFQCAREVDGEQLLWRPLCSLSGPSRPDLTAQCSLEVPISQSDLDEISFKRETSVSSLPLLTLQSSAALPSPDSYKLIYGVSDNYQLMLERLRTSRMTDYDESEMTFVDDYRPDEDTSFGSAYRLAAAGSKRRRLNAAPRPPPPKPPRTKRRKLTLESRRNARKMRRRCESGERSNRESWIADSEPLSPAADAEETQEENTTQDAEQLSTASDHEAVESEDHARLHSLSSEMKENEQTSKKTKKVRRISGTTENKEKMLEKSKEAEEESEKQLENIPNSIDLRSRILRKTKSRLMKESSLSETKDEGGSDGDPLSMTDGNTDVDLKDECQFADEKIEVNCDSPAPQIPPVPPKNVKEAVTDENSSKVTAPVNSNLTEVRNSSRDSSVDSPLAVSSGGECDARSNTECPSLRPRKKQVARKSVQPRMRTPSPLLGTAQPSLRSSVRTRACSVPLLNVHNWYEITGDQPPHACASGSHVLRSIPSYPLASNNDKNSVNPFAYRWEVNSRPRYSRQKMLNKWPTRHSTSSPMTHAGGRKRTCFDTDGGLAMIFARRRPIRKQQTVSKVKLSSKDNSLVKVVSKGSLKKVDINCETTVLPFMDMETDDVESDPNFEILLHWNPKMVRMDAFARVS